MNKSLLLKKGYGNSVSLFFARIFLITFLVSSNFEDTFGASVQEENLAKCLQLAKEKNLQQHPYWHRLIHYRKTLFGIRSQIDDPTFFLSPNGKNDPQAELTATLSSFFRESSTDAKKGLICRYIARYVWLKEMLDPKGTLLPARECGEFTTLLKEFYPQRAVLAFPAVFMNNPASMFGHTLLNIKGREESNLLSKSINYSARTGEESGIIFAFKGIFGFYHGFYEVLPYYARIQLYNDINQRDIWEYELNLTSQEILRMLMHIWELREIYSKYYFFDENCAYNLLTLIEIARPSVQLTDGFKGYVIPIDTIRILEDSGLIVNTVHRPSKAAKINHIRDLLPPSLNRLALNLATSHLQLDEIESMNLGEEEKVHVLNLAIEYFQHRYFKKEIDQESYQKQFLKMLTMRARFSTNKDFEYTIEKPPEPQTGHKSKRLALGVQIEDSRSYQILRLRPAYHDLFDPDRGFLEGSEIEFFDASIRYDSTDEKLEFYQLSLVNIDAISPRNLFFKPVSWSLDIAVNHKLFEPKERHHVFQLNTGKGLSWHLREKGIVHLAAEIDFLAGGRLQPSYAFGGGGSLGYIQRVNNRWKLGLISSGIHYALGETHSTLKFILTQRFTLKENLSFRASITREKSFQAYSTQTNVELHFFF